MRGARLAEASLEANLRRRAGAGTAADTKIGGATPRISAERPKATTFKKPWSGHRCAKTGRASAQAPQYAAGEWRSADRRPMPPAHKGSDAVALATRQLEWWYTAWYAGLMGG